MEMTWIVVAAAAVLAGVVLWRRSRGRTGTAKPARTRDQLDTLMAWQPQATRILTTQERLAMATLVRALPECMILAQVPLARFLKVPTRYSYSEWLHRVGQLCADLVVCDASSQVIAVVDVRAPGDKTSDRGLRRQARIRRVLEGAGIPLHVWTENAFPSPEQARAALLPAPPVGADAQAAAPAPQVRPAAAGRQGNEETGDTAAGALREPPPSTWFDNLESAPMPLGTRPDAPPPR